jgi:hypothetical protein
LEDLETKGRSIKEELPNILLVLNTYSKAHDQGEKYKDGKGVILDKLLKSKVKVNLILDRFLALIDQIFSSPNYRQTMGLTTISDIRAYKSK